MRKHSKHLLAGVLMVAIGVLTLGTAAFAGTGNLTPAPPYTPPQQTITVDWSGMAANQPIIVEQCNNVTSGFTLSNDCAFLSLILVNGTASGSGSSPFTVKEVPPGTDDLAEPWVCDPTGTPDGSGPLDAFGRKKFSTCRIRVTDTTPDTADRQFFLPFTWGEQPGQDVPEAHLVVLLPLGALLLAGGAYVILRNRKPALSA